MSIFQCFNCGCLENTAFTTWQARAQIEKTEKGLLDWTGKEHLAGKPICSACHPTHFKSGKPIHRLSGQPFGIWHGNFERRFLPKGEYSTNSVGNIAHIKTGKAPTIEDFSSTEILT